MSIVHDTKDRGKGVFALRSYLPGEVVLIRKNYMSLRFVNHSCEPNCGLWDQEQIYLKAIVPIAERDEITLDYNTIRFSHVTPSFKCMCGSKNCRKEYKNEKLSMRPVRASTRARVRR